MGKRPVIEAIPESELAADEADGEASAGNRGPLTSAQKLAASPAITTEISPDPFGREAKHFTEIRVLNRDVNFLSVLKLCLSFSFSPLILHCTFELLGPHCVGGCRQIQQSDWFANLC